MRSRIVAALAIALVLMGVLASTADAQRWRERERERGWLVLLGEKSVGFGVDRDVIRIGQCEDWYRDRRFRTLHFIADRNDVHMMSSPPRLLQRVRRGLSRQPADPAGRRSSDRSEWRSQLYPRHRDGLSLASELPRPGRGQGVRRACALRTRTGSRPDRPPGPGAGRDWEELGCQQVSLFGKDRDSIRVGRRRVASRPSACMCAAPTSKCSICGSSTATVSPTIWRSAASYVRAIVPGRWI